MPLSPKTKPQSPKMKPKKKASSPAADADSNGKVAKSAFKKRKIATPKDADEASVAPTELVEMSKSDARMNSVPLAKFSTLSKESREALKSRGIEALFEVQHRAFEPIFSGADTVGRAKTGCGKTLAFVLPIVERIVSDGLHTGKAGRKPLMMGLAPTRELARQIHKELMSIATPHSLKAACLYGGTAFGPQVEEVRAGIDCVVATPGRLLDHLRRDTLSMKEVRFVVLDEADEMLSMGFQEDVEAILAEAPKTAQKLLFSATMPKWVQSLVSKHLKKDHTTIDVVGEGVDNQANASITHQCISCSPMERGDTLADLCKSYAGTFGKTLVFTDTKKECDELAQHHTLVQMGAGVLHGDIPQASREVTMENFRTGKIKLLLATDVAARGLDVNNVELVVNTRPPRDLDTYVHRSGRTGRAGHSGTCVTFYTVKEEYLIRLLRNEKGIPISRRGPPQPHEIVAQAARDAVRQLDNIHQDNVDAFAKVAEELLEERKSSHVFLLSAALAAMTGYTQRIKCRSLLSSYEGSVAMLLESDREIEKTSKAWYLLRNNVPEEVSNLCRAMAIVKGRRSAIFDCPQEHVHTVSNAQVWRGLKFSVATALPELEAHQSVNAADDWALHKEQQKRHWEKVRGKKDEARGTKRKFEEGGDGADSSKGRGKGSRGGGGGGRGASFGGRGWGREDAGAAEAKPGGRGTSGGRGGGRGGDSIGRGRGRA